jgi:hypothetical protein
MEQENESKTFELAVQPSAYTIEDEAFTLAVLRETALPQDLFPLVCVTYKMTLPKKKRMQQLCGKWELAYSDLLRLAVERLLNVIEAPSGEVLDFLQNHRDEVIERRKAQAERDLQIKLRRMQRRRMRALDADSANGRDSSAVA